MATSGSRNLRVIVALLVGLRAVAALHEVTTDAVVEPDGTIDIERHHAALSQDNAKEETNTKYSVEVTSDGAENRVVQSSQMHANEHASTASKQASSNDKSKPASIVRAGDSSDQELQKPNDKSKHASIVRAGDSSGDTPPASGPHTASSLANGSLSSADVASGSQAAQLAPAQGIVPKTAQIVVGVLLPKVEQGIEKWAALHGGKCPTELPSVPGWEVQTPYGYGAGCKVNICKCPGSFEECADGARITGSEIGSGVTETSTKLLGYCRLPTWLFGIAPLTIAGIGALIAYKYGLVSLPWSTPTRQ